MKTSNRKTKDPKKAKRLRAVTVTSALAVVAVLSFIFSARLTELKALIGLESVYEKARRSDVSVFFPDVGSAGCALVHTPSRDILIDCGNTKAQYSILDTLEMLGTDKLDLAVLTHPDSDHIGDFKEVAENYRIDTFLTCGYTKYSSSEMYGELFKTLTDKNIPVTYAAAGDVYAFDELSVEVISPASLYNTSNDNSVVLRLSCGDFSALFTGDISKKAERDILARGADISADLLYTAHHGSSGSSSAEFLKAVSPKYAVISVEEDKYHPSDAVLDRLMNEGCEILRTDISGMIAVYYLDNSIELTEAKNYRD